MTDPAVEVAKKLLPVTALDNPAIVSAREALVDAAREALKPIRDVVEEWGLITNPWDTDLMDLLEELKPLVYSSDELDR